MTKQKDIAPCKTHMLHVPYKVEMKHSEQIIGKTSYNNGAQMQK